MNEECMEEHNRRLSEASSKQPMTEEELSLLIESHLKALKNILEQAKMLPEEKVNLSALKSISELANRPVEQMTKEYDKARMLNLAFLFEHSEKVFKALLTAPKLSLKEKMRRADLQMGLDPKRKASEKKSPD